MDKPQNIVVFGANSAICHEVLKLYAVHNCRVFLVARNAEKLTATADDLTVRGATVLGQATLDFNNTVELETCFEQATSCLGNVDIFIVAHGTLPDQAQCENSSAAVHACMSDNFSSAAVIVQRCAQQLDIQARGTLAVLSSVAGDRGRKSNYVYGAAKAGIDTLLQGLRGRFSGTDIRIVNIKPGMVRTPMTANMNSEGPLWATPQAIAPAIVTAISRGSAIRYVPGYWRYIMLIIRALPTAILARLPI